jgi:hypothetical protein
MTRTVVPVMFLIAFLGAAPARAYYAPLLTTEMIGQADLIALGSIVSLEPSVFTFRVERTLHGRPEAQILVRRFRDWPCASRWTSYQIGQRLILFLAVVPPAKGRSEAFAILGAGDEGEMLVEKDRVYYQPHPDQGRRSRDHAVSGGAFYGAVAPLGDVLDALSTYRQMYKVLLDAHGWGRAVRRIATPAQVDACAKRSAFHRNLALQSANFAEAAKHR